MLDHAYVQQQQASSGLSGRIIALQLSMSCWIQHCTALHCTTQSTVGGDHCSALRSVPQLDKLVTVQCSILVPYQCVNLCSAKALCTTLLNTAVPTGPSA